MKLVLSLVLVSFIAACGGGGGGGGTATAAEPATLVGINDTGISNQQCFAAGSEVLVACDSAPARALSATQDGAVGRDASAATNANADGHLGFQFTLLPGGCVRDEVTGLVWEVKARDGGLRDRNNRYTFYGDGRAGDASAFVAAVNAATLCGASDWRIASGAEFSTLVDYGVRKPLVFVLSVGFDPGPPWIDQAWFADIAPVYWSAERVRRRPFIHQTGIDRSYNDPATQEPVWLVRGGYASLARGRFQISADGQEVTDLQTRLSWRRCPEGMSFSANACVGNALSLTHDQAFQQASSQAAATAKPWRLPNVKEHASLPRPGDSLVAAGPGYDPLAFPALPIDFGYWTSTPSYGAGTGGAVVSSYTTASNADAGDDVRSAPHPVRLVRPAP